MSGPVAKMIQATENIGTQWISDLCNGIVKEGCIPEDWKSSVVLPIYKGNQMKCGYYRGIKLLEHAMRVVERIFKHRIRLVDAITSTVLSVRAFSAADIPAARAG